MRRFALSAALVAALAATAACATRAPSIAQLKVNPARYHNRTVSVEGVVTSAWGTPFVPVKVYRIDDGSGELTVVSTGSRVPTRGTRVRVTGRVAEVAVVGGQALGLHVQETRLNVLRGN